MTAGDQNNGGFAEFKGDIEAAERRVAREIDPGARALVIAIAVFVLLLTFVLPHTGDAKGWDGPEYFRTLDRVLEMAPELGVDRGDLLERDPEPLGHRDACPLGVRGGRASPGGGC